MHREGGEWERESRRWEGGREKALPSPLQFPNAYHSQVSARPKIRDRKSILLSQIGGRGSSTWAILCCLPRSTNYQGVGS